MIEADGFDAALLLYAFPDVYFVDDGGWQPLEGDYVLNTLYAGMRPGAVLGVIESGGSRSQQASGERPPVESNTPRRVARAPRAGRTA